MDLAANFSGSRRAFAHSHELPYLSGRRAAMLGFSSITDFGVQGGVPAQTPLGRTDKMPFLAGPSVDIRIVKGLSLETGLLYQRLGGGYDNFTLLGPANAITFGSQTVRGTALEIPLLAKYRFLSERRRWRPFLLAGPSVRRTSIKKEDIRFNSAGTLNAVNTTSTQWNVDPTVGAGVDARVGRAHIEPEVRYSYWNAGKTGTVRKNQVDFLLGIRF